MHARRLILCALIALFPAKAFAQIDELLGLEEEPKKAKPTKKRQQAPKKAKPRTAPPAKSSGQGSLLDELGGLDPVGGKGELVVKVVGPTDGAQVTVDGKTVAAGERLELEAGDHTVVVKRAGWSDASRFVKVPPGQKTELSIALDPIAGVLTVSADVPGGTVLLNGKAIGTAPLNGVVVPPGMHEIVVRREGFVDHLSRLAIRAGRDYVVQANLSPQDGSRRIAAVDGDRPEAPRLTPENNAGAQTGLNLQPDEGPGSEGAWYGRWYVWAGVGAVAVAAVTTGVLVSQDNGAPRPPSPAEVCRRECDAVINGPAAALARFGAGGFSNGR